MNTKKFLSLTIVSLMLIALLASCGSSSANKPYAFFISHQTNAFTNELTTAITTKAAELGVEVTVYDAEKDPAKQYPRSRPRSTRHRRHRDRTRFGRRRRARVGSSQGSRIPVVVVNQRISKADAADCFVGVENVDGGKLEMMTAARTSAAAAM